MNPNDKLRTIVLQPTSLCNLNCKYCYLAETSRRTPAKMPDLILESILEKVFSYSDVQNPLKLVWHAGEPLTAGLNFYKNALALIEKHKPSGFHLEQMIQTNGVLINEAWCEFIKAAKITMGVSLDGPQHIHDANRVTWKGKGSFELTMRGVRRLQENNIPFYALFVVTERSLDYPEEIFNFFVDNEISTVGFNIEELSGANMASSLSQKETIEERYKSFLSKFIELWMKHHPKLKVREFERLNAYIYKKKEDPNFQASSIVSSEKGILTFGLNGDIVPFSPELASGTSSDPSKFVVGNITKIQNMADIYKEENFLKSYYSIQKGVKKCEKECQYFDLCGGGHSANKYYEHQSFAVSETRYCQLYFQRMIDLLIDQLTSCKAHG